MQRFVDTNEITDYRTLEIERQKEHSKTAQHLSRLTVPVVRGFGSRKHQ